MSTCQTHLAVEAKDLEKTNVSRNVSASVSLASPAREVNVKVGERLAVIAIATHLRNEAERRVKKASVNAKRQEQRRKRINWARNSARRLFPRKRYRLPNPSRILLASPGVEVAAAVEVGAVVVAALRRIKEGNGSCLRRIATDQGPSQNLAVDQGRDPQKVVQDPKVNRVLKAVPDLKAGLGLRVPPDLKAVQDPKVGLVQRAVPGLKAFLGRDPGQRADPVQNRRAYRGRDPVQGQRVDPEAGLAPELDPAHPDPDPDLDRDQGQDPEIPDQTRQYQENLSPPVKMKLRLSCKYFTSFRVLSLVFFTCKVNLFFSYL